MEQSASKLQALDKNGTISISQSVMEDLSSQSRQYRQWKLFLTAFDKGFTFCHCYPPT